jgi:cation diffusion facilitator family transporter
MEEHGLVSGKRHGHGSMDTTPGVRYVLVITLILNESVALAKIIYGYHTGSIGMTSDGFHSLFDGVSNVIGLVGIWIASRPPDKTHPYGHKKYETFFTIIIAFMIFTTCFQILHRAYESLFKGSETTVTAASFLIMIATMAVNIFVMSYESRKGKKLGSDFLVADAMHTKSDILTSSAVLIGLFLTKLGYHYADAIAGVVITFFIARIGYEIIKQASDTLVDTVCLDTDAIERVVMEVKGVIGCHDIRTRGLKNHIYMDMHILVNPALPTGESHEIAESVERKIMEEFPAVSDIVVHVEPGGRPEAASKDCPSRECK